MAERTEVVQKTEGFAFSITIEQEIREETGAKYPDKKIIKATLSGHSPEFNEAISELQQSKEKIEAIIRPKAPEQKTEEPKKDEANNS